MPRKEKLKIEWNSNHHSEIKTKKKGQKTKTFSIISIHTDSARKVKMAKRKKRFLFIQPFLHHNNRIIFFCFLIFNWLLPFQQPYRWLSHLTQELTYIFNRNLHWYPITFVWNAEEEKKYNKNAKLPNKSDKVNDNVESNNQKKERKKSTSFQEANTLSTDVTTQK